MGCLWTIAGAVYMAGMGILGFAAAPLWTVPIGAVLGFACGYNLEPDARYFARDGGWRYFVPNYFVYLALTGILYVIGFGIGFAAGWVAGVI
jgi:hypothetical protein